MSEDKSYIESSFRKDFLWYFIGSLVPMLIGFIKTPIFTRHFDKASFGQLGIVSITFAFLGMMLFSWISSCLWRYFSRYKESKELIVLYSNLFILFGFSLFILAIISGGWYSSSNDELIKKLVFYSFLQLVFNQLYLGYMVVMRLNGKSAFYTVFQGVKSIVGLCLALLLVFYFDQGIIALVSSLAIIDMVSILILAFLNPANIGLNIKNIKGAVIGQLLSYGSVGLILNLSLLSISYSDRYVIAMYYDLEDVGVYDQVAKISQLSVMALITVYFNTINPTLLRRLESDFKGSLKDMQSYMYPFILIGIPLVFYLALFSEDLANILLGAPFRDGYVLMPFIFIAAYLHGFSNFFELRLKFSNRMRKLGLIAVLTAILNILLNLILVKRFGYEWAAHTTLISYIFMLFLLFLNDKALLIHLKLKRLEFYKITAVLSSQYLIYILILDQIKLLLEFRLSLGLVFLLSYFLIFRKSILNIKLPAN